MEVLCDSPILVKPQKKTITEDTLRLTNIDRLFHNYRSILLVYRPRGNGVTSGEVNIDPAVALRRGVEEIVAHYPWSAGRFQAGEEHCLQAICLTEENGGIQFVSARANCALTQLGDVGDPNPALEPLFATIDISAPLHARPLVALQVTMFEDDGVCVSMNSSHALFDGVSASIFLQNIFSFARGDGLQIHMDTFPRELRIKPTVNSMQQEGRWPSFLHELFTRDLTAAHQLIYSQPLAAARFKFSKEDLAQLRREALCNQRDCGIGFDACSRFQALAAHVWKAKAKSLICKDPSEEEEFPLRMTVNVRGRIVASDALCNYMGNAISMAIAWATVKQLTQKSLAFAVEKIQEAIKQLSVERFQWEVDYVEALGGSARLLPTCLTITSLVGLRFYEADFGWGKAACIGQLHKQRRNLVIISEGDSQYTSMSVSAVLDSQSGELKKFQDALQL